MQDKNLFKRFLQNYISQSFLAIFGLIGTIVTIYAFLQEKKVDIRYEILSDTNVLDFNADVNKLNVIYDSTNLRQTKENLRIYTIKIINNGEKTLTKNFYDKNDPIGVKIIDGKIIEKPQIIESSDNYIKRNLRVINYEKDHFNFNDIIIEKGENFVVKFLVLHKTGTLPKVISIGKIAEQKTILVVNAIDVVNKEPFLEKVYFGNMWIQLLRLLSYFIVCVVIIIIIFYTSQKIDDYISKKGRIKLLKEFKNKDEYTYTKIDDAIFQRYIIDDYFLIREMHNLLKDEENLNASYNKSKDGLKNKEYKRIDHNKRIINYSENFNQINEMINDGIVFKEGEKLTINQPMKDTIDKFIEFLKSKRKYRPKHSLKFAKGFYQE